MARSTGPYASANSVRETLRTLSRIFPLRLCTDHVFNSRTRPASIIRSIAARPCVPGHVSDDEYRALVEETALFLKGRDEELLKMLYAQMREASEGCALRRPGASIGASGPSSARSNDRRSPAARSATRMSSGFSVRRIMWKFSA